MIFGAERIIMFSVYMFLFLAFVFINRKEIYVAACEGNGIPQPNEIVKLWAAFIYIVNCGLYMFFDKPMDLIFVAENLGILGIYSRRQERRDYGKS